MTLDEAIAEVKRATGDLVFDADYDRACDVICKAVASGELIPLADAKLAELRAEMDKAETQVGALRLQLDQKDALYDSGFQAGVKLGWNFGVSGDEAGFQAATSSTEHVAELKRIRAKLAALKGVKP